MPPPPAGAGPSAGARHAGMPRARRPEALPHSVIASRQTRDAATGLTLRHVHVEDESDASPERAAVHAAFEHCDTQLLAHPEWAAPEVVDGELLLHNEASRWVYGSHGMHEWRRDLVPSARALYPIQRPWVEALPSGGVLDEAARQFFVGSPDGIGIRTRARVMRDIVARRAHAAVDERGEVTWVSLACGAAVPVLDAVSAVPAGHVRMLLVDMDREALDFAGELAREQGLVEGADFVLLERNLVSAVVARDGLVAELGEGTAAVVDAMGIFEYFSDASCVKLLRNAHRLVAPGGVLVVANMLSDRPQLQMNQRGIGWPAIHPRSVEELTQLVERAGLDLRRTTVHLPQDGVYAVLEIDKD